MNSNLSDPAFCARGFDHCRYSSEISGCFRLEQQLPGGISPTGVTRPFHGAPRILIKNPVDAYIPASAICKCCSRGSGVQWGLRT